MELKDLQTQMQTAFDNLKKAGERQDAEIKKHGDATQETKNTIAAINTAMDEIKNQIADMQTKANRNQMGGGEPTDPKEQEKKSAFFTFMREGKAALTTEQKALVQDAVGEIIVPEQLDSEIYRDLPGLTIMRGLANVRPTSSNRVRRRSMNEVTTGWGKLETTASKLGDFESTLTPDEEWIYVEDALGLVKIGEDELEDTDVNLTQYIRDSFAQAYAEMEDTAFIAGTGHANLQPEGILNGSVVTRFNSGGVGTFEADDLIKLAYAVKAQYRRNGSYIVNSEIELLMRLMKDQNGQYLWQPSLQAGKPNTFNGRPVYNQEDVNGTVATGNDVAIFGDYNQGYRVLDRSGGTVTRINELYIEDGLVGFKYKRRVGGGVVRPNAMKVLRIG
jgi:HK97 family phage major capsid protein